MLIIHKDPINKYKMIFPVKYIYLFYLLFLVQFANAQTYNLTVVITNIKSLTGEIKIGLYNNKVGFPRKEHMYKSLTLNVKNSILKPNYKRPAKR